MVYVCVVGCMDWLYVLIWWCVVMLFGLLRQFGLFCWFVDFGGVSARS